MYGFFQQTIIKKIFRYLLYIFLALICQNMLFTQMRIGGVCPMILPAAAVAIGMFEGVEFGVYYGLLLGLFGDMAFVENTVLFTILFPAIGFFSAFLAKFYINKRFMAFMVLSLVAQTVTALVQMFICLVGDSWSLALFQTAMWQVLVSLPFCALAYPMPNNFNRIS